MDLSFISLAKVLPAVAACAAPRFDLLALVKPQFELGKGRVGKGGVVRSAEDRLEALVAAGEAARAGRSQRPGLLLFRPARAGRQPRELHVVHRAGARGSRGPDHGRARATELEVATS